LSCSGQEVQIISGFRLRDTRSYLQSPSVSHDQWPQTPAVWARPTWRLPIRGRPVRILANAQRFKVTPEHGHSESSPCGHPVRNVKRCVVTRTRRPRKPSGGVWPGRSASGQSDPSQSGLVHQRVSPVSGKPRAGDGVGGGKSDGESGQDRLCIRAL
jgi:hypothetical protein